MISDQGGYFLFNKNLEAFPHWRRKFPRLRAVWVDSQGKTAQGLEQDLAPGVLVIEESLLSKLESSIELPLKNQVFVERGIPKAASTDRQIKIELLPSNDTHVMTFSRLKGHNIDFLFRVFPEDRENVKATLRAKNRQFDIFPSHNAGDVLLMGNDWGPAEKRTILTYKKSDRPSICLQESVLNFGDPVRRMEWADVAFIEGAATLKSLERKITFLTGNPRYEDLRPLPPVEGPVLINCNFTYGLWEDQRKEWVKVAVEACVKAKLDYLIVQHPRDMGDLSAYNSLRTNAANIQRLIAGSSAVITRFSSLVHEALAQGRPVIYFNPHGEKIGYDFEFDQSHLILAKNSSEIAKAFSSFREGFAMSDNFWERYAWRHSAAIDGHASDRVCEALRFVASFPRGEFRSFADDLHLSTLYFIQNMARAFRVQ